MQNKNIAIKPKVIGTNGKGGAGKTTITHNMALGMQLLGHPGILLDNDSSATRGEVTSKYSISDQLKNDLFSEENGLKVINLTNNHDRFSSFEKDLYDHIERHRKDLNIFVNLPGDNALDLAPYYYEVIDDLIIVTEERMSAGNTVPQLISQSYDYLINTAKTKEYFKRVFLVCNKIDSALSEKQFIETKDSKKKREYKKELDAQLFKDYELKINNSFHKNRLSLKAKFIDLYHYEYIRQVDPERDQISIIPLYHMDENIIVSKAGVRHVPFILDYIDQKNNIETLPSPAKSIIYNLKYIIKNILQE